LHWRCSPKLPDLFPWVKTNSPEPPTKKLK
jgi:hypothetical protein